MGMESVGMGMWSMGIIGKVVVCLIYMEYEEWRYSMVNVCVGYGECRYSMYGYEYMVYGESKKYNHLPNAIKEESCFTGFSYIKMVEKVFPCL